MKPAYYNEHDEYPAQWLRNLITAGLIPAGDVDTRSIADVAAADLVGYGQCHFFAGIGGWALAARLAGWPDDRQLWTGSCPCQPFSAIGKREGVNDERHLWPVFGDLIRERRPAVVAGEQVASADGRHWLAGVRADLEAMGYAVFGSDLCAAGVGAPHIRQRIYWLGHTDDAGLEGHAGHGDKSGLTRASGSVAAAGRALPWDRFDAITDRDGRTRRCEPGTSPMAVRLPSHMGRLRAYGNAVVPQLAAEVIRAYLDCEPRGLAKAAA